MGLLSLYFCKFHHKDSLIYFLSYSIYRILLKVYRTTIHSRYIGNEVHFFKEMMLFKDFALENIQTKR